MDKGVAVRDGADPVLGRANVALQHGAAGGTQTLRARRGARQSKDVMAGADKALEDRGADGSGSACEKDPHGPIRRVATDSCKSVTYLPGAGRSGGKKVRDREMCKTGGRGRSGLTFAAALLSQSA
ncbi:hypothetical protein GCM10007285_08350 [Stappia taiwanensis]|nr:hypothetical protein GCM10007285_08350 [Stappia taiwanensis]